MKRKEKKRKEMVESKDNSSPSHEFFKVFLSEISSQKLGLPPAFVSQLQENIPTNCSIKDRSGRVWHVNLEKAEGSLIIANGWQDFAKFHSLVDGDFLIFKYDGNSQFKVKIYGKNGLKKRKAPSTNVCGVQVKKERREEKTAVGQYFSAPTERNDSLDPVQFVESNKRASHQCMSGSGVDIMHKVRSTGQEPKNEILPTTSRPLGLRPDKGYKMRNLGVPPQRFQSFGGKFTCTPSNSSTKKKEARRVKTEEEQVSPLVRTFDPPKNPHFPTLITPATRYRVYFPRSLTKGKNIKLENNVTLQNDDGKFWSAEVRCSKDDRFHLSKGWAGFRNDNKLVDGDMCIFEFVMFKDNICSILLVHIVRNGSQTMKPVSCNSEEEASDVGPNVVLLDD